MPARILRSFLKQPGNPNIPIQAIGLSLYESLPTDSQVETPGTKVTRTQWLDLSSLEMANLIGKHVLIVEDIVDSGLTLSWLLRNLATRHPRSLRVCTLMRKPDAVRADVRIAYVGFDIPNEFVVGFGLDYAERYRDLPYIGTLDPRVYA